MTVSMPAYYSENGVRKVLGVAGVDVTMSQMQSFGFNDSQIVTKLLAGTPCFEVNLTDCEIENLRGVKCGISCPSINSISTCTTNYSHIFLEAENS